MQKVGYIDLHCDSLTAALSKGGGLRDFAGQVNFNKLKLSGASAQCFAIFTDGDGADKIFESALELFFAELEKNYDVVEQVVDRKGMERVNAIGKVGAVLTVENLGFTKGDLSYIPRLKEKGVKICSLVWNNANEYAFPNFCYRGGTPDFTRRESKGLTALGRQAAELLEENKIIIDISHLSDGGVDDLLKITSSPVVATHSNAYEKCRVSRNLTDLQIKKIADRGGVIGVNFCRDFLGEGDALELVGGHIRHIIDVGGEDCVALGSDFDGIPVCEGLEDCTRLENLFERLSKKFLTGKELEKLTYYNFARLL
ncbi:MAG: dipeptidase [Candidatus Coproplasma sp.]